VSSRSIRRASRLLPLVALSCGQIDGGPAVVFDPCRPTTVVPAAGTTGDERSGIAEAISLWAAAGGPPLVLAPEDDAQPTAGGQILPLGFEAAAPIFYGLYRAERGDIVINRQLPDPRGRAITVAHEIGHAFGLMHETARRSLMSPGNLVVPPGETEVRLILERRGSCDADQNSQPR
jgi:hypothetical protein